jgi:hypothetical protein
VELRAGLLVAMLVAGCTGPRILESDGGTTR